MIALIDPDGERSFLTDRGANEALEARDIPDALIEGAALIHLSGYSFFAPSPREAVFDVMRRAEQAYQRRSSFGGVLARGRRRHIRRMDARRGNSVPQRRGSCDTRRLDEPKLNARGLRSTIRWSSSSAARPAPRPWKASVAGVSTLRRSRWSTPPAPATPSSPDFSPPGLRALKSMLH